MQPIVLNMRMYCIYMYMCSVVFCKAVLQSVLWYTYMYFSFPHTYTYTNMLSASLYVLPGATILHHMLPHNDYRFLFMQDGRTALDLAIQNGQTEVANLLRASPKPEARVRKHKG